MHFQISGLPVEQFTPLFGLSDEALAERGVVRVIADRPTGFPCRVSLRDARPGDSVLLLNYEHQSAASPYRSSHAIFVQEHAQAASLAVDETPAVLIGRLLSVRAFDARGFMVDAEVVDGRELTGAVERLFASPVAAYLHVHNAKHGCYAARIDRA